jgi:(2Fe-2S) ferredoxin
MRFERHVFICTNQRVEGTRPSCGEECGLALVKEFKKAIKDKGIAVKVRAQRTGCLDACEHGPAMVVYPEGVFYGNVQLEDVDSIVESHLVNGKPVDAKIIRFDP